MFPAHAVKQVFSGTTQGGEVFAHSLWFDFGSQPSQADLDNFCATSRLTFNSQVGITAVKSALPNTTAYTNLTLYSYAGGPNADLVSQNGVALACTGTASNALPDQLCMVMSILTGIPGRSFRGRSYLPACAAASLATTGQAGSGTCDTFANAWAGYINGMQAGGGGTPAVTLVVASAARSLMTPAILVSVDSRLDTQRRRSAKQVVTYKKQVAV